MVTLKAKSELRRKSAKNWPILAILALLVVSIALLGLIPLGKKSLLSESIQEVGHFAFFGFLALVGAMAAGVVWPSLKSRPWLQYTVGFLVSMTAGVGLEAIQAFLPYRSASIGDILSDLWGALAGTSLLAIVDRPAKRSTIQVWAMRLVVPVFLVSSALGIRPFISCSIDYIGRNRAFPIVVDFQSNWIKRFRWKDYTVDLEAVAPPADWPAPHPAVVTRMTISPGEKYPGFGVQESASNWTGYDYFAFDAYGLNDQPFEAVIRINDFAHDHSDSKDRFRRRITIRPGHQIVRISLRDVQSAPQTRSLDMTSVWGIKLYVIRPDSKVELLMSNWRLEKR